MYRPTLTCSYCGQIIDAEKFLGHEKNCSKSPTRDHDDQTDYYDDVQCFPTERQIEQEMREHPWADRVIAERIVRDHLQSEPKLELWWHDRRGALVKTDEVETIEIIEPRMVFGQNRLDIIIEDWEVIERKRDMLWKLKQKR